MPGGKEGRPSEGAEASANVKAILGVAASAQTSDEEQALLEVEDEEEIGEENSAIPAPAAAVVAACARRRRPLVSLVGSHHCESMAVEAGGGRGGA